MYGKIKDHLIKELAQIRDSGLFKDERVLAGRQGAKVELADGRQVINLCANNFGAFYLRHPAAAQAA
jgi:glycine C-acetyltransferase